VCQGFRGTIGIIAGGAGIDANLTKREVQTIAQGLVNEIFGLVPPGDKLYVAAGRKYGIKTEAFAFQTTRGYQIPLLNGKDGTRVTVGMLTSTFGWMSKRSRF
jgi:hypothetical protein